MEPSNTVEDGSGTGTMKISPKAKHADKICHYGVGRLASSDNPQQERKT